MEHSSFVLVQNYILSQLTFCSRVKIFSIFVRLMQVTRLRFRHKTCGRKEQVIVPFTQSRNLLVIVRLGDIEKMERKMLGAFSSHFFNVGYAKR